jgi:GNAT superfamily N-acetyltransferase
VRRPAGDGYELDDDPARIDREAVHRYLSKESYWAKGRSRGTQDALVDNAARVVGLYRDGEQVGFSRAISDGHVQSYLADVYVLDEHRGHGLGLELVRETVDGFAHADAMWLLRTNDMHALYEKLGFEQPDEKWMVRPAR